MNNKKSLVFFGILMTTMLAALTAEAQVANYAGSNCVVNNGAAGAVNIYSNIQNSSSSLMYVDCPAVNESPTNIESGWVKVLDQNDDTSNGDVKCWMNSIYVSGSQYLGWSYGPVSTSGFSSSYQTLSFGGITNSTSAHVYYTCQIPKYDIGASAIATYQISE